MSLSTTDYEVQIIHQIRSAKSIEEVSVIIDSSYRRIKEESKDESSIIAFANEMQLVLSGINPIYVVDATEWSLIQEARVLYFRLTKSMLAASLFY